MNNIFKPTHQHDCDACVLVMKRVTLTGPETQEVMDFYWCPEAEELVSRIGPYPEDYSSCRPVHAHFDAWGFGRALRLATEQGLVPQGVPA